MALLSPPINTSIQMAVQSIWIEAGYDAPVPGIVPLYELIANYPLWVAEVEDLSFERAVSYLAERTGQTPELGLSGSWPISGFLYAYLYRTGLVGCILVEKGDPIVRRRFSVAHELGHYKLHFLPQLAQLANKQSEGLVIADAIIYPEEEDASNGFTSSEGLTSGLRMGEIVEQPIFVMDQEKETEANQFAAELLMPTKTIQDRIAALRVPSGQPRGYLAKRLASEFLVSKEAMNFRLASLKI